MAEFREWPKIARLNRDMIVTEKIDGTNGAIHIEEFPFGTHVDGSPMESYFAFGPPSEGDGLPEKEYLVTAQSRSRIIYPSMDNHGFAAWVWENAHSLIADLGVGLHFGEWAGGSIGKRYAGWNKSFWLFNVKRWNDLTFATENLRTVPVLHEGPFDSRMVNEWVRQLGHTGSFAYPSSKAEGVVAYHVQGNTSFKVTLEKDDEWKGKSS